MQESLKYTYFSAFCDILKLLLTGVLLHNCDSSVFSVELHTIDDFSDKMFDLQF